MGSSRYAWPGSSVTTSTETRGGPDKRSSDLRASLLALVESWTWAAVGAASWSSSNASV